MESSQNFTRAEIFALGRIAHDKYLPPSNKSIKSQMKMYEHAALTYAFMRRRYSIRKNELSAMIKIQGRIELMLRELGVGTDSKSLAVEGC